MIRLITMAFWTVALAWTQCPPSKPDIRIGIVGNPIVRPLWSDAEVKALAGIGFNEVQLNIAWGSRPFDEPLDLLDVVTVPGEQEQPGTPERRAELRRRVELARRYGLRTLFHFGSPYMNRNPYTGEVRRIGYGGIDLKTSDPFFDVTNPLVAQHEFALLAEFRRQFPDVDDILVYTYDQDAWQASEFGPSKFSRGIPIAERLPPYLRELHRVWTKGRENRVRMWWEPWELSAGEIYKMLPQLPRKGCGIAMHSNIAEAQVDLPVDLWFRNMARMCRALGIPVIAEGFYASMNEEIEPLFIPDPRLVDQQFLAVMRVEGVVGIKEYYGVVPLQRDFNLDVLKARLAQPASTTAQLMDTITRRFGPAQSEVQQYLALLSDARQVYPWDASWFAREAGRADVDHGWHAAFIRGQQVESPSWRSTRHAIFMSLDDRQPHPFMIEDLQLRFEASADQMGQALTIGEKLLPRLTSAADRRMFEQIQKDGDYFRRVARSYALHLRETNVAQMLREDLAAGRPMIPRLVEEMQHLLAADVENQWGRGRVIEMERQFREDPAAFVRAQLVPTDERLREKGTFSLTTR